MQKLSISFLGKDGPGIVATVSLGLNGRRCSILESTQNILGAEFAAIFIVEAPDDMTIEALKAGLEADLARDGHDISVLIREAATGTWNGDVPCQPYVVSADGTDGLGQIGALARVFARHNTNIESLKAILGHGGENRALFVLEVSVPETADTGRLSREIQSAGRELGLRISMQHRDIFEAMHRVADF